MDRPAAAVWMDQGGTFTDVVRVRADGSIEVEKHLSDRVDLEALGAGAKDVRRGTTIATNALLERTGVPVLLVVTRGFGDLAWIGDQTRPDLFALHIERAPSLATEVVEVDGRLDAAGNETEPHVIPVEALRAARARGLTSAAVALVHGPLRPEIEDRIAQALRDAGFAHVSVGHEVAPSRGFLERLNTTLADAALTPLLPRAAGLYLRSDGGLSRDRDFRGRDAILSGPAGGVIATARVAKEAGLDQAFGLDMGGTSTDVCRVAGEPGRRDTLRIGGLSLRVPAVELDTIAAGGGSILRVRAGTYEVGPASAGADPGPAAYGRGGPATLTDAEAVLGRLPMFPAICGPDRDRPLDLDAARAALEALDPTRTAEEVALGFREVAAETTARAVRRLAASLGVDPRTHGLVAFGGAGPAHACAIAERLGIDTVIVPFLAGAFSAVGIGAATRRAVVVAPVIGGDIPGAVADAERRLPFAGTITARLALRFVGTSTVLDVALETIHSPRSTAHIARDSGSIAKARSSPSRSVSPSRSRLEPLRSFRPRRHASASRCVLGSRERCAISASPRWRTPTTNRGRRSSPGTAPRWWSTGTGSPTPGTDSCASGASRHAPRLSAPRSIPCTPRSSRRASLPSPSRWESASRAWRARRASASAATSRAQSSIGGATSARARPTSPSISGRWARPCDGSSPSSRSGPTRPG